MASAMNVEVMANTDRFVETCRTIAKHLTALADELELQKRSNEVEREP